MVLKAGDVHRSITIPESDLEVLSSLPPETCIDLLVPDMNGIARGKQIPVEKLEQIYQQGCYLPYSIFDLDVTGQVYEGSGYLRKGDPDTLCYPIAGSLRPVDWTDPPSAQLLLEMKDDQHAPFVVSPRVALQRVLRACHAAGWHPSIALEYEFYIVDSQRDDQGRPQPPVNPRTKARENGIQVYSLEDLEHYHSFINDARNFAHRLGVAVEATSSEYGPGQFEINIHHSTDVLSVCDQLIYLKRLVKAAAHRHHWRASFMAKVYPDYSGSGAHLHLSVQDSSGVNLFADADEGSLLSCAVGGLCATMTDYMLLFAPHINSYRRFCKGAFVPLTSNWADNNRSVAVRIPNSDRANRRIEHRVAGADANPYTLAAGVLAGALMGMQNKISPPSPVPKRQEPDDQPTFPANIAEAIAALANSPHTAEYFDPLFIKNYLQIKRGELSLFRQQITPWEYHWYLHNV